MMRKILIAYSIVITIISFFLITELRDKTYDLQEKEIMILESSSVIDSLMTEQHYFIEYLEIKRKDDYDFR